MQQTIKGKKIPVSIQITLPPRQDELLRHKLDIKFYGSHYKINLHIFVSKKKQPVRLGAIKRLGVSKLLLAQLERVLSDTKEILDNTTKDRDVEFLFGLLPLCVLTGKIDILKDAIETEGSLSGTVRAEAARYIEKE